MTENRLMSCIKIYFTEVMILWLQGNGYVRLKKQAEVMERLGSDQ